MRQRTTSGTAAFGGLLERAGQHLGSDDPAFTVWSAVEPIISRSMVVGSSALALLGALDHASFARSATSKRIDHRTGNRSGLEDALSVAIVARGLEHEA